jgi:hypothetical protein
MLSRRMLVLLALVAAALAVAVAFSSLASVPAAAGALALDVVPVLLDETDASRDRVGARCATSGACGSARATLASAGSPTCG